MTSTGIATDSEDIYNLATECNALFSKFRSQVQDGSGVYLSEPGINPKIVEEHQQRFRAWITGLGVFAEPYLSLDSKLKSHPEVQELVIFLLDIIKTNLVEATGVNKRSELSLAKDLETYASKSLATHHQAPTSQEDELDITSGTRKSGLQNNSEDGQKFHSQVPKTVQSFSEERKVSKLKEILYGVEGSLTRLERLSYMIRQASKGGLSRKVQAYAKKNDDSEFDRSTGLVLNWLFPKLDFGLAEHLRKSIVYRRYRLLYQRRHRLRFQVERNQQPVPPSNPIESRPTLVQSQSPMSTQNHDLVKTKEPQRLAVDSALESKSGRSTLDKGFNTKNSQVSPPASEISGSSAAWTGNIDYPTAPKARPSMTYVQCPICHERYDTAKFMSQRAWRRHVDEDLEPYVCLSEDCSNPLSYFPKYRLWKEHMRESHSENWLQLLFNQRVWACNIGHEDPLKFTYDGVDELIDHISNSHKDRYIATGSAMMHNLAKRSQIQIPRPSDVCPICQTHVEKLPENGTTNVTDKPPNISQADINPAVRATKLSRHIASHLKMLAFRSLRGILEESDDHPDAQGSSHATHGQERDDASDLGSHNYSDLDDISLSSFDIPLNDRVLMTIQSDQETQVDHIKEENPSEKNYREDCLKLEPNIRMTNEWDFITAKKDAILENSRSRQDPIQHFKNHQLWPENERSSIPQGLTKHSELEAAEIAEVPFVVIGIDYGTTYTGVAWARSRALNEINVISKWNNAFHDMDMDKVPTEISYDENGYLPLAWGFAAKNDEHTLRWVKLLLSSLSLKNLNSSEEDVIEKTRKQMARWRKQVVDVIADYLHFLWSYVIAALERTLTTPVLDNLVLKVVLTIPAIWDHKAQQGMLRAAEKAGIRECRPCGKTEISLIAEPAAAAIATFSEFADIANLHMKAGDSFTVCDAGGGTVDLVSYKVESFSPLRLSECVGVTGDLCGAAYLDRAFLGHIKAFRQYMNNIDSETEKRFMEKEWEPIKRNFDGTAGPWIVELPIDPDEHKRLSGIKAIFRKPESRVIDLNESINLKQIFNTGVRKIIDLLKDQVHGVREATGALPKFIVLVGGFGGNQYLLRNIERQFPDIAIQQPSRGWSAVCRGAVYSGLQGSSGMISNHISKYYYGVRFQKPWEEAKYRLEDKWFDKRRQKWSAANQIDWFLRKNDDVNVISSIEHGFSALYKDPAELKKKQYIIYYTDRDDPGGRVDEHTRPLCRVKVNLSSCPFEEFQVYKSAEGAEYREVNTILKMSVSLSSIHWSASCLGKEVPVEVEYIESDSSALIPT